MKKVSDYKINGNLWAIYGAAKNLHYLVLTKYGIRWGEHLKFDEIIGRNGGIESWIDSFQEAVLIPITGDFQAWQDSVKMALEIIPAKPEDEDKGRKDLRKLVEDTLDLIEDEIKDTTTGTLNLYSTTAQYLQQILAWIGSDSRD